MAAAMFSGSVLSASGKHPELRHRMAMDIVGTTLRRRRVSTDSMPIAGAVIDPHYHVNFAWYGPEPAIQASLVAPVAPSRGRVVPAAPPLRLPVPPVIPVLKGKVELREVRLLDAVKVAVAVAGVQVQDAWAGASAWSRDSDFLLSLTASPALLSTQVDEMFRDPDVKSHDGHARSVKIDWTKRCSWSCLCGSWGKVRRWCGRCRRQGRSPRGHAAHHEVEDWRKQKT